MKSEIHLRNVLAPFLTMMAVRYIVSFFIRNAGLDANLSGLIVFLAGAVPALLIFYLFTGKEHFEFQKQKIKFTKKISIVAVSFPFLIVVMHLVSVFLPALREKNEFDLVKEILSVIFYPVMEECIFRKLFYGELRKINVVFGILTQAVMFALVHYSPGQMIFALFAGIVLGLIYEQTKDLTVPFAIHLLINLRTSLYSTETISSAGSRVIDISVLVVGFIVFIIMFIKKKSGSDGNTVEENVEKENH